MSSEQGRCWNNGAIGVGLDGAIGVGKMCSVDDGAVEEAGAVGILVAAL